MDVVQHLKQLTPAEAESAYNRLTSYRFVQRYVGGKSVADIGWEELGYGTRLLAEIAESVTGLTGSPEALELASKVYTAPNASYRKTYLLELPYQEEHFDVVVAFEVIEKLEHPEDLVKEAKRVLKQGGIFVVSTPDKQAYSNDRNYRNPLNKQEMHTTQFRELLERHFKHVRIYWQGVVAGGLIFEDPQELSTASVDSCRFSSTNPSPSARPPTPHFAIAVCSDSEIPEQGTEQPYLLLDHDQRIFNERDDYREDVELLRDEIRNMQETEVQAFHDTLRLSRSEAVYREAQLRRSEAQLRNLKKQSNSQIQNLKAHIHNIESSRTWRLLGLYQRLRAKMSSFLRRPQ